MSSLRHEDQLLNKEQVSIGNSETDTPVTASFPISSRDSELLMIDCKISSLVGASAVLKLQSTFDGGTTWIDHNTSTASGSLVSFKQDSSGTNAPIRARARIVVTTDGSSSVDVDAVFVSRRVAR